MNQDLQDAVNEAVAAVDAYIKRRGVKKVVGIGLGLLPGNPIPFPWGMQSTPADPDAFIDGMSDTEIDSYVLEISSYTRLQTL